MTKGPLKISKGTRDTKGLTSQNSLYANNLQFPEIARDILMLFPQYSITNITAPFIMSEENAIGDLKFMYPVMGRTERALTCTGTAPTGDGAGDSVVWIEVEEGDAKPTWEYKLGEVLLRADDFGKKTVKGWLTPFKIMGNDDTDTVTSTMCAQGRQMGPVANSNTEFSEEGFGEQSFPDWLANYLTTTRYAQTVTGDAAASILWLEKNAGKLWAIGASPEEFFNELGKTDGGLLWKMEKDAWHGKTTMTADGRCTKTYKGKPLVRGNGLLQQIPQAMSFDYGAGTITSKTFLNYIANFKVYAGISGGKIMVTTGAGGAKKWYEVMSRDFLHNGNRGIVYTMENGRNVTVGEDIPTFHALGVDITVVENPILTDTVLNPNVDEEGFSINGCNFYFMDANLYPVKGQDGKMKNVPVVQKMVRRANGIDRSMIVKVVDGMVNPVEPEKIFASNARDGYSIEWLSQWLVALRKVNGMGALLRTS